MLTARLWRLSDAHRFFCSVKGPVRVNSGGEKGAPSVDCVRSADLDDVPFEHFRSGRGKKKEISCFVREEDIVRSLAPLKRKQTRRMVTVFDASAGLWLIGQNKVETDEWWHFDKKILKNDKITD